MTALRRALPTGLIPRGITVAQAAAMVGLSESRFAEARMRGDYPNPTLPGGRIDRVLLERAMDRLSGIYPLDAPTDPLSAWEQKRNARTA